MRINHNYFSDTTWLKLCVASDTKLFIFMSEFSFHIICNVNEYQAKAHATILIYFFSRYHAKLVISFPNDVHDEFIYN